MKLRGEATFDVLDWSALVAGTRVAAGLDGFDSAKVRLSDYFSRRLCETLTWYVLACPSCQVLG